MFDWITGLIETSGYLGIALLMFAENVFPPIPSELIMPLAGFTAARGDLNFALVILAGTLGSVAGTLLWYVAGRLVTLERLKVFAARHGRWLTLSPEELERAQAFFLRHCGKAVLLGRLAPAIRTVVSVPAGIVRMGLPKFLLYSTLGTILWNTLLAGAGYMLEAQYQMVAQWMNPVTNTVLLVALAIYFYRVATFRRLK
ncbi:DedA family protein [Microvirga pakistanensis]|uniref:DedA family protein n=1 Tax=Microvirga pakistanensis TaxID=1682650 RepID=UPI00106916A6|nr:DedA family protein [Microvirga pakistanensis]